MLLGLGFSESLMLGLLSIGWLIYVVGKSAASSPTVQKGAVSFLSKWLK
jgi:hypothetical protein